jgi:hypothetical protein
MEMQTKLIHAALIAAEMATPAMAACELPAGPAPFTTEQLMKNPYLGTTWTRKEEAEIARCRQAEADKAAAQEREDIHAVRLALEEIASRMGK